METKVVLLSDGVEYYEDVHEGKHSSYAHLRVDLGKIDWLLLAQQKMMLLKLVRTDEEHILNGVLFLIDHIQDEGARQGEPVVWCRPVTKETCDAKQ